MQNYNDLVLRFKDLKQRLQNKEKRKYVTRKEIMILANDMTEFVKEEHPEDEKRTFWPLGYLENIFFLLDESNSEKTNKFADDEKIESVNKIIFHGGNWEGKKNEELERFSEQYIKKFGFWPDGYENVAINFLDYDDYLEVIQYCLDNNVEIPDYLPEEFLMNT